MHQQPPKTPLLRSTRAANASHVVSSRPLTVYAAFGMSARLTVAGNVARASVSK